MSWYEWALNIPWYWWVVGFGIESYCVANIWITHRRVAVKRAGSPYLRPGLLTFVLGYAIALPLIVGRKLIRRREY